MFLRQAASTFGAFSFYISLCLPSSKAVQFSSVHAALLSDLPQALSNKNAVAQARRRQLGTRPAFQRQRPTPNAQPNADAKIVRRTPKWWGGAFERRCVVGSHGCWILPVVEGGKGLSRRMPWHCALVRGDMRGCADQCSGSVGAAGRGDKACMVLVCVCGKEAKEWWMQCGRVGVCAATSVRVWGGGGRRGGGCLVAVCVCVCVRACVYDVCG